MNDLAVDGQARTSSNLDELDGAVVLLGQVPTDRVGGFRTYGCQRRTPGIQVCTRPPPRGFRRLITFGPSIARINLIA